MSESKTPTPRTDKVWNTFSEGGHINHDAVFNHARTLELELNAANKQIAMDTVRFKEMQETGLRHEVELNEVNEKADYWQKEHEAQRKLNVELSTQLTTAQKEIKHLKDLQKSMDKQYSELESQFYNPKHTKESDVMSIERFLMLGSRCLNPDLYMNLEEISEQIKDSVKRRTFTEEDAKEQQEIAELRKDKERLDWLESAYHRAEFLMNLSQDARSVIDSAMKGTKE